MFVSLFYEILIDGVFLEWFHENENDLGTKQVELKQSLGAKKGPWAYPVSGKGDFKKIHVKVEKKTLTLTQNSMFAKHF